MCNDNKELLALCSFFFKTHIVILYISDVNLFLIWLIKFIYFAKEDTWSWENSSNLYFQNNTLLK